MMMTPVQAAAVVVAVEAMSTVPVFPPSAMAMWHTTADGLALLPSIPVGVATHWMGMPTASVSPQDTGAAQNHGVKVRVTIKCTVDSYSFV